MAFQTWNDQRARGDRFSISRRSAIFRTVTTTQPGVIQVASMTVKTILLINSEPNIREVMQVCLSQLGGWQVLSTGSPSAGLSIAVQSQPDAIVLDLTASDMDYITFLQKLRADAATQTVPVVILTSGAKWLNLKYLQEFQVAGALEYLPDPTEIPKQIAKLLNWAPNP